MYEIQRGGLRLKYLRTIPIFAKIYWMQKVKNCNQDFIFMLTSDMSMRLLRIDSDSDSLLQVECELTL